MSNLQTSAKEEKRANKWLYFRDFRLTCSITLVK